MIFYPPLQVTDKLILTPPQLDALHQTLLYANPLHGCHAANH